MFDLPYEKRLQAWREFRGYLETASDPIQDVINWSNQAQTKEPELYEWSEDLFPEPWELIGESKYSPLYKTLLICYTLQLTDRFCDTDFEIHISTDTEMPTEHLYLLRFNKQVIGYEDHAILASELPNTIVSQRVYAITSQQ